MEPKPILQTKPYLTITWNDNETTAVGYVAVHDLVGGIATGGCRMRAGCTLREVEDLAYAMSTKTAVFDLHAGGAKGGINVGAPENFASPSGHAHTKCLQKLKQWLSWPMYSCGHEKKAFSHRAGGRVDWLGGTA